MQVRYKWWPVRNLVRRKKRYGTIAGEEGVVEAEEGMGRGEIAQESTFHHQNV